MEKQYIKYLAPGFNRDLVLEDLMTTYGQDVWNFAFFLTRRADAADDISQDVFLIVYNRLYTFRGESSIKTWILSITRNKALNYLKSAFIRKVTLIDTMLHFSGQSPSAEQVVLDHISSRAIWEQVLKLPLKFREVIILNYHFELSVDQIAATLQISEGTVKSRLHRAKKKMSVLLDSKREGV